MSQTNLYDVVGPDAPALSEEERRLVDRVTRAVDVEERVHDEMLADLLDWRGHDEVAASHPERIDSALPALDLPGFGDRYDDCGAEIPHFCEGCGHTVQVGRTCRRSRCPRCGSAWVLNTAPGHVGRLDEAARMMSSREGNNAVYKHHVVMSPPKDWFLDCDDPLDATFHVIRDMLDAIGAEGFVYYHPWSGSDDHEDDRGQWKSRLFQDRDWEGDVRDELGFRPHFHAVVVSPHIPGGDVTKEIYNETGWVTHRITERNGSPVSLGDLSSVARAVSYCLSHTGVDTRGEGNNRAAMRAYGPAIHDCLPLNQSTRNEANKAVRQAAPTTLGLSTGEIACRQEVPEDEADRSLDADDLDDGDGDGLDSTSDDLGMVPCGRGLCDIDDADEYLEDDDWRQNALHVDDLEETKQEWDEAGGWEGWQAATEPPPD